MWLYLLALVAVLIFLVGLVVVINEAWDLGKWLLWRAEGWWDERKTERKKGVQG